MRREKHSFRSVRLRGSGMKGYSWVAAGSCLILICCPAVCADTDFRVTQKPGTDMVRVAVTKSGHHEIEIDDAAGFRNPVLTRTFTGSSLELRGNDAGLIPGVLYRVRLDHGPATRTLRIVDGQIAEPELNCTILRTTWQQSGRFLTGVAYSQLRWDDTVHRWTPIVPAVPLGESLFNVEYVLRPALSAARACNDLETLDEIAR